MAQCDVAWLGRMGYREAAALQRNLAARRLAGAAPNALLLLEHPPTITVSRGADPAHVLASPDALAAVGVAIEETDRGGDVTYHGPGQLVGYPILNLAEPPLRPDLHLYLRSLEETVIRALAALGIEAGRFPGHTGVWVGMQSGRPEKIAAIGVKAGRWITQHGFAINVDVNLSYFDLIVPCGIRQYGVTSISRILGTDISVPVLLGPVTEAFGEEFGLECVAAPVTLTTANLPGTLA